MRQHTTPRRYAWLMKLRLVTLTSIFAISLGAGVYAHADTMTNGEFKLEYPTEPPPYLNTPQTLTAPTATPILPTTQVKPGTDSSAKQGTLSMLYQQALNNDPSYRAAFARGEADAEAYVLERAFLLPRVDVTADITASEDTIISNPFGGGGSIDSYGSNTFTVQLVQPIFHWEMLAHLRRGEVRTEAARVQQLQALQNLTQRLINTYLDLQLARVSVQLAETNLAAIREQLSDNQVRYDVGAIAITGLKEAQSRFDLARADVIDSQQALLNARLRLEQITGSPAPQHGFLEPRFKPRGPMPNDLSVWSNTAIVNNLSVGLAALNETIAEENIAFARQDHFPEINLVGSYTERDSNSNFGSEAENQQIGLRFSLPLFRGGATLANVRAARQNYIAANADLDFAQRQANIQSQTAFYAVQSAINRISALELAIDSSEASLQAVQDGFNVGSRTTAEVLDSRTLLISNQQRLIAARYDYLRAMAELAVSIGKLDQTLLLWIDEQLSDASRRRFIRDLPPAPEMISLPVAPQMLPTTSPALIPVTNGSAPNNTPSSTP